MRTIDGDKVFAVVRRHIGLENAISAPQIVRELRWPPGHERQVRRLIANESRDWPGVLVCAAAQRGYFCAETYDEAETYHNWLSELANVAIAKRDRFRALCKKHGFNFAMEKQAA